jgi:ADP-heptose:LPS heptosyltransferase
MRLRAKAISGVSRLIALLARTLSRGSRRATSADPRRILILKPCCLGDVLMSTPLVEAVRSGFPQAELTYAVGTWSRPVIEGNPHIDRVLDVPDRWTAGSVLAVARELRKQRFDMVFVPERTPVPGILCWLAGIPLRIGLDSAGRGFAYTHPVPIPATVIHEAELYLELARAIGLPLGARRLWFVPAEADRAEAARLLRELEPSGPLVILHPGGGSNPGMVLHRKRWLPERWALVADDLHDRFGADTLIVGSAAELDIATQVQAAMRTPATVMTRQWQWGVLAAMIEHASLFLGHDTGMSLLANAVGAPHLVVFGPSDPQMYGPYGANGRAIWRPTAESPCFYQGSAPDVCPCAGQCMRNVGVEDALNIAGELLTSKIGL